MQNHAYDAMHTMQEHHWWWNGMRQVYRASLKHFLLQTGMERRIIDVGCGFGANLSVLSEYGSVVGVDVSLEALQSIKNRPTLGLVQAAADALPFRADTFDVIALLAVIEHVDRDDIVLSESYRVGRRGSIQIMLTSAFMALWSHHDIANNHRRRYHAQPFNHLQNKAGWHKLRTSYINAFLFPVVLIVRTIQRFSEPSQTSTYDMGPDLGIFSKILQWLLSFEGWWILGTGIGLPFGVDLLAISIHDIPL